MYIKQIKMKNYGPIHDLNLNFSFRNDGTPNPMILVGRNGAGKTLLLSQIVQSVLLDKSNKYNVIPETDAGQLYKLMSPTYIESGESESYTHISYDTSYEYSEIFSADPNSTIQNKSFPEYTTALSQDSRFTMHGMFNKIDGDLGYDSSVFLYFPVDRYYIPGWRNSSLKSEISVRIKDKIVGKSERNVICYSIQEDLESYIVDTVLDQHLYDELVYLKNASGDILVGADGKPQYIYDGKNNQIITLINNIINEFKDEKYDKKRVYIGPKENRRVGIIGQKGNAEEKVIDSFSKLSTGEYSLLSMFIAILMDYDKINGLRQYNFQSIKGIVVIDEAELNLHIDLQMKILPRLMKMFKNIQFVITTQSPFLVYGIKDEFGENCDIYDMPYGFKSNEVLSVSEVKKSYDAFINHNEELLKLVDEAQNRINNSNKDLIVITEGKTDPIYLKKAMEKLNIENCNIDFIGLGTPESREYTEGGNKGLDRLANALTVVAPPIPVVCMYDRDVGSDEMLSNPFIKYGHNLFKMCIPVPTYRRDNKDICIEHYFKNTEIKRKDSNGRRMYLGNEFNQNGLSYKGKLMCEAKSKCGKGSIKILDGADKTKVFYQNDDSYRNNIALPKKDFATNIKNNVENFNDFDFSRFKKIFNILQVIINDIKNDM